MNEKEKFEIIKEIAECNKDSCKDCKIICSYYSAITSFCEKVLPEGTVVLSKEEYNDLKGLENRFDDYLIKEIKETRKETAKEILEKFISELIQRRLITKNEDLYYEILELKDELFKQYGVEVEE